MISSTALDEKYRLASKWPTSERYYKTFSGNPDQLDGDQVHVEKKGSGGTASRLCSKSQLTFVIAAAVQMMGVVAMQVLIIIEGGHGGRLPEFQHCLSDNLQRAINCSIDAKWKNVTIPSFGKDKPVYVGFIIALTVYNAMLCIYALFGKHFLEMVSFLVVNVLTMVYAAFEAWQFRPFGPNCTELPSAGWLALGSVGVLFVFTVLFVTLSLYMYRDFGWKVYKDVDCNHNMRKYYQWYEALSSGVKLLILFTVVFSVAQLTLLLTPDNYEFELTIILVVVAIVAYFVIQLTIHYTSFTGHLLIAVAGVLLFVYYAFKIIRFSTESCPICLKLKDSLNSEYKALAVILGTCTNSTSNTTLIASDDRSIQFQNLVIFASVNFITTIVVFVIYFGVWCCQPGNKLRKHFKKHPSAIVRLMCYRIEDQSREKSRGEEFRGKFKEKSLYQLIKTAVMTKFGHSTQHPYNPPPEADD